MQMSSQHSTIYFKDTAFISKKSYIVSQMFPTPSSDTITTLKPALCLHTQAIHIQFAMAVHNNFLHSSIVLYK